MRRDFVPAPTDLLCGHCGYVLNGLADTGNCPECGHPVADSTVASGRSVPAWESGTDHAAARFTATARFVLSDPRRFFRTLVAHGDVLRSRRFGFIAIAPAMLLNTKTILMHYATMTLADASPGWAVFPWLVFLTPPLVIAGWLGLHLAVVRLTSLEARYWGFRLPLDVVRRAMHYLAVQASAASVLPWIISLVYLCLMLGNPGRASDYLTTYLYTLSGAVVVVAVYLFYVYVAAMKALMYANR